MSPYAASTVCIPFNFCCCFAVVYSQTFLSLFLSLPLHTSPLFHSLALSLFFILRDKRLLTSSRLMEPFFPQRNSGCDLLFQCATQCTTE
uniref:Uncharacterized protein n=1 Tax=Apteryx owenii TaxID=8824 RepID=A0A8B9Q8Y3_APTOW